MNQDNLTTDGLKEALKVLNREFKTSDKYKRQRNQYVSLNDLLQHRIVEGDDPLEDELKKIVEDKGYQIAYKLIKKCCSASGRKGETILSLMEFLEPFIIRETYKVNYSKCSKVVASNHFNKYLLPLLVLTAGNYISYSNYWSMKVKININLKEIALITQSEEYINLHKKNL